MTPLEFPRLVAAVRSGDEHAFGLLWRQTDPGLLRYLRVVAAGRVEQTAAATWHELLRVLGDFRGTEAQWRTRVYATARRLADAGPRAPLARAAGLVSPGARRFEDVVTELALAVVAELPPAEREVLVLRTSAALSVAQIAEITSLGGLGVRTTARDALARASILAADPAVRRRIDRGSTGLTGVGSGAARPGPMPSETALDDLLSGSPARPGAGLRTRLMAALVAALAAPATVAELRGSGPAHAAFRSQFGTGGRDARAWRWPRALRAS